jgi:hypothetical protein
MSKVLNHAPMPSLALGEDELLDPSTLLLAEDELWRSVRAAWAPAFSPQRCVTAGRLVWGWGNVVLLLCFRPSC